MTALPKLSGTLKAGVISSLGRHLTRLHHVRIRADSGKQLEMVVKCSAKLMPAIAMNTTATASTMGLSKKPMLASCEEKPPIDTTVPDPQVAP